MRILGSSVFGRALGAALALATPAQAGEGMWTLDNAPTARMREETDWAPDQAWLDRAMASAAQLPGCSASLVSGQGLVLTNYHCIDACVRALSSGAKDFQADGFVARGREEELRCEGLSVRVLGSIRDVTGAINAASAGAAPEAFASVRDDEIARLRARCGQDNPEMHCEVVTLYQGGRYALYAYRVFEDVRLVFAPEEAAAYFGFPQDNFAFPRFCADFAFLRVYEDGAPARTPQHFSMRFAPPALGEAVTAVGNPGRTSRLSSSAQLAFQRDHYLPLRIADLGEWRGRLVAYAAQGPDEAHIVSEALLATENSFKAQWGRRLALADARQFARVVAAEQDLQARVARNRAMAREIGDPWGEIEAAQARAMGAYLAYEYLEARAGGGSHLYRWARDLVRAGDERAKPSAARLRDYSEGRIEGVGHAIAAAVAVDGDLEEMQLAFWLSKARERLGAEESAALLGGESPEALAHRLTAGTALSDRNVREALWRGGAEAIAASRDPLIMFVRARDAQARAARTRYETEVAAPVARAQERIARARFRAFGLGLYPEPTATLRLSYGRIEGWRESDGREIAAFTRFGDLGARVQSVAPYRLAPRWGAQLAQIAPETTFNVAASVDAIGGSSGSAMLDTEGRVVGMLFDGNVHSLGGEYFYDGALNRAVGVTAQAIGAVLKEIYAADALVGEIEGSPSAGASGAAPP